MWNQDLFKRALDFAAAAHGDQKVPGSGHPYVVHLTKVTTEVLTACVADPSLDVNLAMVCALLHDTVEDANVLLTTIEAQFGKAVSLGVSALTKADLPKEQAMRDSLDRIKQQPREIAVVKLGDRITNLEPPPAKWSLDKRRAYHVEAKQIARELGHASAFLETRIQRKLREYEKFLAD